MRCCDLGIEYMIIFVASSLIFCRIGVINGVEHLQQIVEESKSNSRVILQKGCSLLEGWNNQQVDMREAA